MQDKKRKKWSIPHSCSLFSISKRRNRCETHTNIREIDSSEYMWSSTQAARSGERSFLCRAPRAYVLSFHKVFQVVMANFRWRKMKMEKIFYREYRHHSLRSTDYDYGVVCVWVAAGESKPPRPLSNVIHFHFLCMHLLQSARPMPSAHNFNRKRAIPSRQVLFSLSACSFEALIYDEKWLLATVTMC